MLLREGLTVFVCEAESKIVSTCMLITAPNLLRSGRQHAFLENVVTHPDFRGRGFGRAVVLAALAAAWEQDCLSRLPAKRPRRPARASLLRRLRFRAGAADGLCSEAA